jgi:AraC-like DNA-binding protein
MSTRSHVRPSAKPASGSILVVALKAAPRMLASMGVDPAEVARRARLDLRLLGEPEGRISFHLAGRFIDECVRASGCEHFGLLLGTEQGLGALGLVGHLIQHSSDVGTGLRNLSNYLHHQEIGGVATVSVDRGIAALDYAIELPGLPAAEQVADAAMGIGLSLMRFLCGSEWAPRETQFMHPRPRDTAPFKRAFASPVRFGAERNALLFDARWLDHRIASADPVMRRMLEARISELETDTHAELPARVRGVARALLLAGDASCEAAAQRLAMTRRTFHRRLAAHGVSYETLLDQLRFEIARQLLRHSAASLTEVSAALNYANVSAFTRAFRRWSGSTPGAWRAEDSASS